MLPNRARQVREVRDLLIAERVVLLHAPSGAGKSSLIEAGVVRELYKDGFYPTRRVRVNLPPPDDLDVRNRYVLSVGNHLLHDVPSKDLNAMTMFDIVVAWGDRQKLSGRTPVLIIDQLEEVLRLDPTDWPGQDTFFEELSYVALREKAWLLLGIREDLMGGLHRFMINPGMAHRRYRLDFLDFEDARRAVQIPAQSQNVEFSDDAVDLLLNRLAEVEVQRAGHAGLEYKHAPYIQPFQLQVTCTRLWVELCRLATEAGREFTRIDALDVAKHASVGRALTLYYGETVGNTASSFSVSEAALRAWFEDRLANKALNRTQTQEEPEIPQAKSTSVIQKLEETYLIETVERGGAVWHELSHDRLVKAVVESNDAWRREHLKDWQLRAREWDAKDRSDDTLLIGPRDLHVLPIWTLHLSEAEKEFINKSQKEAIDARRSEGIIRLLMNVRLIAIVEAWIIAVLSMILIISMVWTW